MYRYPTSGFLCILLAIAASQSAAVSLAQSLLPMQPGMAVATCGISPYWEGPLGTDFVVGVMDVRNPPLPLVGRNWIPPMYHGPNDSWTSKNLGQIFGICIDAQGNIYVTATTVYGTTLRPSASLTGPGGPGAVYRLDGRTGAISTFAQLPNTGPALGNICYDRDNNQFFVTDFEDGKIYRLSSTGAILSTFDPFVPDDGKPGFAPLGERLWGIGVYDGRVYYSVWWEYSSVTSWVSRNEIRSVALDGKGEFNGDDRHEFYPPSFLLPRQEAQTSPISDIAFSSRGEMLVAERSMSSDTRTGAHRSRVFEYKGGTGNWGFLRQFYIGNYARTLAMNSAGGVDFGYGGYDSATNTSYGCDQAVWASGDALRFPGYNPDTTQDYVYGVARLPASGNSLEDLAATSYYVDLDADVTQQNKTFLGDIEIFRIPCTPSTIINADTITLCDCDTIPLRVPPGLKYRWTPPQNLSCVDCRTPFVFANANTTYTAEVTDASGAVARYTRTLRVLPSRNYVAEIGKINSTSSRYLIFPIEITPETDLAEIDRFVATVSYQKEQLVMENGAAPMLETLLRGTIASGWNVKVTDSYPGFFRAEFTAPSPAATLRGKGALINLLFSPIIVDTLQSTLVSTTINFPLRGCITLTNNSDTIRNYICGIRERMITFNAEKFSLDVRPNVIADRGEIEFGLGLDGPVRIELFNTSGVRVAVLAETELAAGGYSIVWEPDGLPSGLYFLRLTSGTWSESRDIIVAQ